MSGKNRERVIKEWENRVADIVEFIEANIARGQKPPISPVVVSAISVVSLYESSKKIEFYSKVLACLTVVLVILTAVLAIGTFLP